ncbi:MAG: SDR family oxidoreductase [Candidatus Binatia bacterium]
MQPLAGRVGVVTGASGGIGAAVARALAEAGMAVVLGARRSDRLEQVRDDIRARGGRAAAVPTDMRDDTQVERLISTAVTRYGQIDTLVNNAAVGTLRPVAEGRTDEWRAMVETNFLGVLAACRAALQHMLPQHRGDILSVTSASAYEAWPYLAVYAASKAAIHSLSRGLRAEVAGQGVRVMTIEVHNVAGTDFASHFDPALMQVAVKHWEALGLVSRASSTITPHHVARAVVFQLSLPEPASVHHLTIRSRAN